MPNTRLGLWKSIKRRGKDVVSTASASSTVEESVSCGTSGSGSKQTLLPGNHPSNDNHESRSELMNEQSTEKHSGPVDEIIIKSHANPCLDLDTLGIEESPQYTITEDGRWRLKTTCCPNERTAEASYKGPVDVDAYIQDDSSTSTTSEERQEIVAIKKRLQSRHASKVPRQIVLYDNDDYESNLAGYDGGFGTLFDDAFHNSYPFDEAARDVCTGKAPNKTQSQTQSFQVNIRSSQFGKTEVPKYATTAAEKRRALKYQAVSRRPMAPDAFEC